MLKGAGTYGKRSPPTRKKSRNIEEECASFTRPVQLSLSASPFSLHFRSFGSLQNLRLAALTGGISGGLTAAAGRGNTSNIALGALGEAAGGVISNLVPGGPVSGAFLGYIGS